MMATVPQDTRALVAIDLGAESCRVSLLRWMDGKPHIRLLHRFSNSAEQREDGLRWNLRRILSGIDTGLRLCADCAPEGIRSVAVDGWAVDYVRLDEHDQPIADPYCYRDGRTLAGEAALHQRISAARMRELTGIEIQKLNTAYQMCADAPPLRSLRWLNLPEYVLQALGGRAVAEFTNATHTQLVGMGGAWSQEILAALDGDVSTMPEIVPPGSIVGEVQGSLRELPGFANTQLIAPCCHDTASAIAAVPDSGEDWAYISSGTWSLVGTVLKCPVNSAEAQLENFTNLGGADGTICFHKGINGLWLLRQCIETWTASGAVWTAASLVDASREFAENSSRRKYVLDVSDPDLLSAGDMPARINRQLRRRHLPELAEGPEAAPELSAFLFHSLASRYAKVLAKAAKLSGKRFRRLYIMGGGSQNGLLNELTAQTTGLKVIKAGTECSIAGNFAVQLATLEKTEGARPAAHWANIIAQNT